MTDRFRLRGLEPLVTVLMVLTCALVLATPSTAQGFTCLPTCDTDPDFINDPNPQDSKFLAISGPAIQGLSSSSLSIRVVSPAGAPSVLVGVFDGDSGAGFAAGTTRWDIGPELDFSYQLLADPLGDGVGATVVPIMGQPSISSLTMADNAWTDFVLANDPAAMSPSGNFIYRLVVTAPAAPSTGTFLNAFKVRSGGVLSLEELDQPFAYIGGGSNNLDFGQIFPSGQSTPTIYDGQFDFFFDVAFAQTELTIFDGDFDRGRFDGTELDTDDPNSSGVPLFATPDAVAEGVAVGTGGSTGAPPDDFEEFSPFSPFVRTPSVRYDLIYPDGQSFPNENPSGNQEWEAFVGIVGGATPAPADYAPTAIPAGTYRLAIQGVDMSNLNALRLPFRVLCIDELGNACVPLRPFLVGDTVFLDDDGNGVQNGAEAGIAGVTVNLLGANGLFIASTTTDGNGNYSFEAEAGTYTCEVDLSSPPLAGLAPSTSTSIVDTVTTDNRLDYDFGFETAVPGSIGDRVWYDENGNGAQDEPPASGLAGVTVELRDGLGNVITTTTTDANGFYLFPGLAPGDYTVDVIDATLPGGFSVHTTGNDPLAVMLGSGEDFRDADFGYDYNAGEGTATIGDRIWNDVDGDGADLFFAEPSLNGVVVNLEGDVDGDSLPDVFGTLTTGSGFGIYLFTGLAPGTYTVTVDFSTVPAGLTERTFDFDGVATPDTAVAAVGPGTTLLDVDFGYRAATSASVGDRLWLDLDGNGLQDAGEPGINGVSVDLLDAGGVVISNQVTSGDGDYDFGSLVPGDYTVRVDGTTLPAGLVQTFELDGSLDGSVAVTLAGGDDRDDVDFGYQGVGSIGDRVWLDINGDGVQDAGEPGVSATVELFDAGGNSLGTQSTDGNGNYGFGGLPAGDYTVVVTPGDPGLNPTFDPDGTLDSQHTLTLGGGQNIDTVDFGYNGNAAVGDRLWLDLDGNSLQDAGEPGINGVSVDLLDAGGNVIASQVTSGDGNYNFTNLAAGSYSVRVDGSTLPGGLAQTFEQDGSLDGLVAVTLATGEMRDDVDFGYVGTGSIGDLVWNDIDGNGVQDPGEEGFSGVTVTLTDAGGNVVATTTTGFDGGYLFTGLPAGTFTVTVDPATLPAGANPASDRDGTLDNETTVNLGPGENVDDADFGYNGNGSIGDRVWFDQNADGVQDAGETGFAGVTVTLLDSIGNTVGTDTTDANGNYAFGNLLAGDYTVVVDAGTLPGGTVQTFDLDGTLDDQHSLTLGDGDMRTDVDFGYTGNGSVGDRVWNDLNGDGVQDAGEAGISGLTVTLLDAGGNPVGTDTTDANGNYGFANLPAGDYTVVVTPPAGFDQTFDLDGTLDDQHALTLGAGDTRTDVDFGYRGNGSIGDRVWDDENGDGVQDAGENGINGVTVELLDAGGVVIDTQVTSGDGNYAFTDLPPGDYTVRVTPPADTNQTGDPDPTFDNESTVTLLAGDAIDTVDFGYQTNTGSIGDRVWLDQNGDGVQDAGENGINGVTVELFDDTGTIVDSQITAGDGDYLFVDVPAGDYTVRVTPPPLLFQTFDLDGVLDDETSVTLIAGDDRTDVDFGYDENGSIGDRVWLDLNGDGIQDAGENGINGVTVELFDDTGIIVDSQVTSGDGDYLFDNVEGGDYTVRVTPPPLLFQTFDLDGVLDDETSVTLIAGDDRTDVDFGYDELGSIGDRVWLDENGDGIQDAGENGINGVTVELFDDTGIIVDSQVTSGDGDYLFDNVEGGDYTVRVTPPPLLFQTFDLDGVLDDETSVTLIAGDDRTDVDFGYDELGSIGDRVWFDENGDGIQDAGEAGLNGWIVELFDDTGIIVDSQVTSGDGDYLFDNVEGGDYTVRVTPMPGFFQTFDLDGGPRRRDLRHPDRRGRPDRRRLRIRRKRLHR